MKADNIVWKAILSNDTGQVVLRKGIVVECAGDLGLRVLELNCPIYQHIDFTTRELECCEYWFPSRDAALEHVWEKFSELTHKVYTNLAELREAS